MGIGNKISRSKLNTKLKELPVPVQEHCKRCKLIATFLVDRIRGEDWFFDAKLNPDHILSAVFLHDIGKTAIPKENIYAEHSITKPKQAVYRSHIDLGVNVIDMLCGTELEKSAQGKFEKYVYEAISEHHEAADGCGFPKRLTSRTMSITGKITAIADTVDNLFFVGATETRDYDELTDKLESMAGNELDAELLGVMLQDKAAFISFIKYIDARYQNKRKTDNYGLQMRFFEVRNIIENETREFYTDFVINDPFYGLVKPEVYIPVAEMSSQTMRLTLLMVERICLTIDKVKERGGSVLPISLCIEASCFEAKKFVSEMIKLLIKYKIREGTICLVIDEGGLSALDESINYVDCIAALKNGGYSMAIKMMSEGTSLIGKLDTLDVDYLYIDASYTKRLTVNSNTYGVASGLLDIAHNLHLSVVFLGVDTHGVEKNLLKMRARYATGALYGQPLKENEYVSLMAQGRY